MEGVAYFQSIYLEFCEVSNIFNELNVEQKNVRVDKYVLELRKDSL